MFDAFLEIVAAFRPVRGVASPPLSSSAVQASLAQLILSRMGVRGCPGYILTVLVELKLVVERLREFDFV